MFDPADWALAAIPFLRVLRLTAWSIVMVLNIAATTRLVMGRPERDDLTRALMLFVAASEVGFASIWIMNGRYAADMHPAALVSWVGMHILSIMSGLAACWIIGATERARGG